MYSRTDPARCTVAIVVTALVVCCRDKFGAKGCLSLVVIRVEDFRVGESSFIVMQSPAVDDDSGALGNEFTVDPVI